MGRWDDEDHNRDSMSAGFSRREKEFAGWPVGPIPDAVPIRESTISVIDRILSAHNIYRTGEDIRKALAEAGYVIVPCGPPSRI